jgi:streptomycin 6-kinase
MTEAQGSPTIPDDLKRRWSISSAFLLADTPSSIVYRVTLASGEKAVLKLLKPRGIGELPGMAFLRWRDGNGAIRLIDSHGMSCLLEDAGDLTLRQYRLEHGEAANNRIIADVLGRLHAPSPAVPQDLTPLDRHFAALFDRSLNGYDTILREPLGFARQLALQLLSTQDNIKPLHGDLHHDNIVSGGTRGWLAIDPQGLMGDPAYDVANIFGNPLNALPDIIKPARIKALTTLFSQILECGQEKILRYAIAHAGLSICWSLEDGTTFDASENARERLAFLQIARTLL